MELGTWWALAKLDLVKAEWISSRGNRKFTVFVREQ
jgi:hypothetical protein